MMEFGVGGRLDIHLMHLFLANLLYRILRLREMNYNDLWDQSKTKTSGERTKGNWKTSASYTSELLIRFIKIGTEFEFDIIFAMFTE